MQYADLEKFSLVKAIFQRSLGVIAVHGYRCVIVGVPLPGTGTARGAIIVVEEANPVDGAEYAAAQVAEKGIRQYYSMRDTGGRDRPWCNI